MTRAGTTAAFSYDANARRVSLTKGDTTRTYARNSRGDVSLLLNEPATATASLRLLPMRNPRHSPLRRRPDKPLNPYRFNDLRVYTGSGSIDMGVRHYSPDVGCYLQ